MPEADITRQTLAALGVSTSQELSARFDALRAEFDKESASAPDEAAWKALRDAWLGRKSGVLNRITEHWLKPAPPELRPPWASTSTICASTSSSVSTKRSGRWQPRRKARL